ncbi:MAG: hypothetical protein AAB576_08640 [Elusimicrobiota bacterium]
MEEAAPEVERGEGPSLRRTLALGLWLGAVLTAIALIGTCTRFGEVPGLASGMALKVGGLCAAYAVAGMLLFFKRGGA